MLIIDKKIGFARGNPRQTPPSCVGVRAAET
jgi:hypothetical protein